MLADTDPFDVLENLEGNACDRPHRARESPAKLGNGPAIVAIVKARVAQECIWWFGCHALP